ncbi:hypothetical protein [Streptomyces sp. NPDC059460]|uniref:hypothetical protein n=1 Tax=Streptomyces sp. NPDC059460 TaxID=3346840 RepID=UPI00368F879C
MRRIGSTPAEWGSTGYNNCPDLLELDTGDFLVIGTLVGREVLLTDEEQARMRELGASVGVNDAIVEVPREVSRRAPRCELPTRRSLRAADLSTRALGALLLSMAVDVRTGCQWNSCWPATGQRSR